MGAFTYVDRLVLWDRRCRNDDETRKKRQKALQKPRKECDSVVFLGFIMVLIALVVQAAINTRIGQITSPRQLIVFEMEKCFLNLSVTSACSVVSTLTSNDQYAFHVF